MFEAVTATMKQLKGSYSVISLISQVFGAVFGANGRVARCGRSRLASQVGLFAFRDPFGIRPLVLGHRVSEEGPEWCFASEDCAFGPLGFIKVPRTACRALHPLRA